MRTDLLHYELLQAGLPVIGVSSDGRIDYSRPLTPEEAVLANQVIEAHDPNGLLPWEQDEQDAVSDYNLLPDWLKTWTANEASTYIHANVLNGFERADIDDYITNLPNTIVGIKMGMTQIGYALVDMRNLLEIIAKLLIYIRNLVIKYR